MSSSPTLTSFDKTWMRINPKKKKKLELEQQNPYIGNEIIHAVDKTRQMIKICLKWEDLLICGSFYFCFFSLKSLYEKFDTKSEMETFDAARKISKKCKEIEMSKEKIEKGNA